MSSRFVGCVVAIGLAALVRSWRQAWEPRSLIGFPQRPAGVPLTDTATFASGVGR
jgi:hypothetical protein